MTHDAAPPKVAAAHRKADLENQKLELELKKLGLDLARHTADMRVAEATALKEEAIAQKELAMAGKERIALEQAERKYLKERSVNSENRIHDFVGGVGSNSVETAIAYLSMWSRQSEEPITVRFTSPGGSVIDGLALYDYILSIRNQGIKVTTVTLGMAASMASILLQAGDERLVGPNAYVLIHEIAFGAIGKIGEIEDEVAFARALNKRVFTILAERSTLSYDEIATRAERKDWWLNPEEVIQYGFADRIAYR